MNKEHNPTALPTGLPLIDPLKATLLQLDYTTPRTLRASIHRANNGARGEGGFAGMSWDSDELTTTLDAANAPRITYNIDEEHCAALYEWHQRQVLEVSPLSLEQWDEQVAKLVTDIECLDDINRMAATAMRKLDQLSSLLTKAMRERFEYQRRQLHAAGILAGEASAKVQRGEVMSQAEAAKLSDALGRCRGAMDIGHGLNSDRRRGLELIQETAWSWEHQQAARERLGAVTVQESHADRRAACLDEVRADIMKASGAAYGEPARVWLNELSNLLEIEASHCRGEKSEDQAREAHARREFVLAGLDALHQFDRSQEVASEWESDYLNALAALDTTETEWPAAWAMTEQPTPQTVAA